MVFDSFSCVVHRIHDATGTLSASFGTPLARPRRITPGAKRIGHRPALTGADVRPADPPPG
ncbi:hypothetical protein L837_3716 [Mycobacterium avium MAV_061107_1842]|nr:hypothetical protein L837_3716 [Mycobacterium avium MAV_061107_1842]